MKVIVTLIKFYIVAVVFAYALAAVTGLGTYLVLSESTQQGDTYVYRPQ